MQNTDLIKKYEQSIGLVELIKTDPNDSTKSQLSVRGTAFVISDEGLVATCAHVYEQIPENERGFLMVTLPAEVNDKKIKTYRRFRAKLVKIDQVHDLAILQPLEMGDYQAVAITQLGDLEDVVEGEELMILGYPLATELLMSGFGITMTASQCIVSSIKRRAVDGALDFFMVDTHVNNGLSGSPVFLKRSGEVIGVVSRKVVSSRIQSSDSKNMVDIPANIGTCQPINYLKKLISQNE